MAKINKEVLLTQERLKQLLSYNQDTGEFTRITRGRGAQLGATAGYIRPDKYVVIHVGGHRYLAHRLVWLYVYGYFPEDGKSSIDHLDQNPSNNRIENLRAVSHVENMRNQHMKSNNTSGINGINRTAVASGSKTKINYYQRAFWVDKDGNKMSKSFSERQYGEDKARILAINYREEQLRLLEVEHNIIYAEKHGI